MEIPNLLQILLWISAGLGAIWVLILKGIIPFFKFTNQAQKTIPVLKQLTDELSNNNIIDIIVDMANQFKTDSGSSLRDVVNRLEVATTSAAIAVDLLRVSAEGSRQLADADRAQIARLLVMLDSIQLNAIEVATDLKDSQERAAIAGDIPGEAADAAVLKEEKHKGV